MSAVGPTSQVAILGARGQLRPAEPAQARPLLRLGSFAALGLYGTLRWSTLLAGREVPRLLGLLVVAVLLAGARAPLARRSRWLAAVATVVALIAMFPIAGVPLSWLLHLRIAVTANAIGEGLTGLPQALVPYSGVNQWVTLVIVLGAGVLLLDAALLVAFAPRVMEDLRRAGAALPLVALAAVPTTLVPPVFPYLDGLLLFALLAAFVWGERIAQRQAGAALGLCALAGVAAMFAGPALDRHQAWINPRTLAGGLTPAVADSFDWSQDYGRLAWPRDDRVVLEVQAKYPAYWKAENLDVFNGVGWTQGNVGSTPAPSPRSIARWTQTLEVTVGDMRISQVIGAGTSQPPTDLAEHVVPGSSLGTWNTESALAPGDSYRVRVYTPQPSSAELQRAGTDYRGVSAGYRTIELPPVKGSPSPDVNYIVGDQLSPVVAGDQVELAFPPFHSRQPISVLAGPAGASGRTLLAGSQYASTYQLARRLATRAATPYDFARAVKDYLLNHGYSYSENPPHGYPPLVSFLFGAKIGYCQQFAGAMALLLRMGGVPARVAVGFTPGHRDSATGRWLVTDLGAHAWVEAWFPGYGWETLEATPPIDPALGGRAPIASSSIFTGSGSGIVAATASKQNGVHPARKRSRPVTRRSASPRGGGVPIGWLAGIAVACLGLLALALRVTRPISSGEALVAELERGMRRLGRPLPPGGTLAWLERRVSASPEAAGYVRSLRLIRFAGADHPPSARQRRALRRELRLGLSPLGRIRALWALPPRRRAA